VSVAVTNEGAGIAPEDLPRLFGRFVRTDDAARGTVKGIGLGLYIVRELVAAHGGDITAHSTPGHRTTFRFTIPASTSALHRLTA
jgi:two-component system sensor histidine kinase BaeS